MKVNIQDFEAAIAQRFPRLDRTGDGKIDIADARAAVAQIRNELVSREEAAVTAFGPLKASLISAGLAFVVGLVVGGMLLGRLFH
jgi:hypothetical protein